jgi:hypothetical protein
MMVIYLFLIEEDISWYLDHYDLIDISMFMVIFQNLLYIIYNIIHYGV